MNYNKQTIELQTKKSPTSLFHKENSELLVSCTKEANQIRIVDLQFCQRNSEIYWTASETVNRSQTLLYRSALFSMRLCTKSHKVSSSLVYPSGWLITFRLKFLYAKRAWRLSITVALPYQKYRKSLLIWDLIVSAFWNSLEFSSSNFLWSIFIVPIKQVLFLKVWATNHNFYESENILYVW
jgi:hypothetical protein